MKKELFAAALLIILLSLSMINSYYLNKITGNAINIVEKAKAEAENDNWDNAITAVEDVIDYWNSCDTYTHIVLSHNDIDSMTNNFYELLEHIYSQDIGGTMSYAELVKTHLDSIGTFEKVKLGSIF